jgi:sarcosine oxidase subunit delta
MTLMPCPMNGPRNIQEFVCGGEVKAVPSAEADDAAWSAYLFLEENRRGVVREWWCHAPTSYWFIAERDTATDTVLRTYDAGELRHG